MKLKDSLKKRVIGPLVKRALVLLEEVIDIVELIVCIFK